MQDTASISIPVRQRLRPGDRVWVQGREATLLYARQAGAVVRYSGESMSRVVSLRKVTLTPAA